MSSSWPDLPCVPPVPGSHPAFLEISGQMVMAMGSHLPSCADVQGMQPLHPLFTHLADQPACPCVPGRQGAQAARAPVPATCPSRKGLPFLASNRRRGGSWD